MNVFLRPVQVFGCQVFLRTRECFGGNKYLISIRSALCVLTNPYYSSGRIFRLLQAIANSRGPFYAMYLQCNQSCRVGLVDVLSGDVRDGASKLGAGSKVTTIGSFSISATHGSRVPGAGMVGWIRASLGKQRGTKRDSRVRQSLGLRIEFAAISKY